MFGEIPRSEEEIPRFEIQNRLLAIMSGALATDKRLRWPPDALIPGDPGLEGDHKIATLLVKALKLTEAEWFETQNIASEILALPSMIRASRALSSALLKFGALPGEGVYRICDEAMGRNPKSGAARCP